MTNRRVAMLLVVASTAACGGGDPVDPVEDRTSGDGGSVFCTIPQDDLDRALDELEAACTEG